MLFPSGWLTILVSTWCSTSIQARSFDFWSDEDLARGKPVVQYNMTASPKVWFQLHNWLLRNGAGIRKAAPTHPDPSDPLSSV